MSRITARSVDVAWGFKYGVSLRAAMTRPSFVVALLLAVATTASAHEHVTVADKYELTVGWRVEPPFAGQPNGLDLKVEKLGEDEGHEEGDGHDADHHAGARGVVLDAHEDLTVTYEYGGKTFEPVDFRPAFGRPGWYTGEITPTRPGVYLIHITGTIEGTPVDVRVEPHEIESPDTTSFPEQDAPGYELAERIADLETRVAKLEADLQTRIEDPHPMGETENRSPSAGVLGAASVALIAALALRSRR